MKTYHLVFICLFLFLIACKQTSKSDATSGTFQDPRDGRTYAWVKIGSQTWMAENLAYLPRVSPPDQGSETEAFYYVYGYHGSSVDEASATDPFKITGVLYNWPAAQSACPGGWHLPGDNEWYLLINYLGGYPVAGKKLKFATGFTLDKNSDNSSGFSAKMGGVRTSDYPGSPADFLSLGMHAFYWTNTQTDLTRAKGYQFQYDLARISPEEYPIGTGLSVRCVKNN